MIKAWSTTQVYAAEAILSAEVGEGELLARAVAGLVEVASARIEQTGARRVVALVGSGNNGADALYAVAALCAGGLSCAALYRADAVHADALASARAAGVVLVPDEADEAAEVAEVLAEADLVIDGILGIGGRGGLPGWATSWVAQVPDTAYVLAVDVPSGHDPNGGQVSADGVFADETVTFSVAKPVHLLPPTEAACGRLTVVDIGLSLPETPTVARLTHDDVASLWPVPSAGDDKYSRGVLGVVAGSAAYPGAAVLAVTAAAEAGAGMVRYVGSSTAEGLVRAAVPEAIIGPGQVQAWVVGPGLVVSAGADDLVAAARAALASPVPVVLDAGGLDLVQPGWQRAAPTLLTPHAGECARLLTRLAAGGAAKAATEVTRAMVEQAPVAAARELAELTGATVLLKGATTLVAAPDGRVFAQCDAPPWLATAGAGDVLAGLLGVLLAAGVEPLEAGALGALVHGVAADRANPGGPVRALAVARALPATMAALLRR